MKGFGHKARKALRRYVKTMWRENQPPAEALPYLKPGHAHGHLVVASLDDDLTIYALGIIGEDQPFEYGFVSPGAEVGPSSFLPIESRELQMPNAMKVCA